MENQAQDSQCIKKQRLMVLWQERIKMLTTKVQKKHKNIIGLKFRPIVTQKKKLREVMRKRGKVPLYPYFTPKLRNCENVSRFSGFWLSSFSSMGKTCFNRSETSTHSHTEEEIEEGREEEREDSLIPIFPPLRFRIVRLLTSWMGFYSEISGHR